MRSLSIHIKVEDYTQSKKTLYPMSEPNALSNAEYTSLLFSFTSGTAICLRGGIEPTL
jgi:hypothetical protein